MGRAARFGIGTPSHSAIVACTSESRAGAGLAAACGASGGIAGISAVGMDLLGRPWSEPTILRVAYAYERLVAPRKPPKTTPPLAGR